jgi:hypothetical protein
MVYVSAVRADRIPRPCSSGLGSTISMWTRRSRPEALVAQETFRSSERAKPDGGIVCALSGAAIISNPNAPRRD